MCRVGRRMRGWRGGRGGIVRDYDGVSEMTLRRSWGTRTSLEVGCSSPTRTFGWRTSRSVCYGESCLIRMHALIGKAGRRRLTRFGPRGRVKRRCVEVAWPPRRRTRRSRGRPGTRTRTRRRRTTGRRNGTRGRKSQRPRRRRGCRALERERRLLSAVDDSADDAGWTWIVSGCGGTGGRRGVEERSREEERI